MQIIRQVKPFPCTSLASMVTLRVTSFRLKRGCFVALLALKILFFPFDLHELCICVHVAPKFEQQPKQWFVSFLSVDCQWFRFILRFFASFYNICRILCWLCSFVGAKYQINWSFSQFSTIFLTSFCNLWSQTCND